jgi:ATPase subunit of ABC transporter with duplicated ATPase domains
MITVNQLSMRYGAKILFDNAQLQLLPGEHIGLIGANGSGKSTFLKILSSTEQPTSGSIIWPSGVKVGILEQDFEKYEGLKLLDIVISGQKELYEISLELDKMNQLEEFDEEISIVYANLEERFSSLGGYIAQSEAARLLDGLGLTQDKHEGTIDLLSGGFKLRVLLAKLLYSDPDVLLLDEPTNHLDLYSIRWLENYLLKYKGILVVTSHDREFIDNVANAILDVDFGAVTKYKGNYSQYLRQVEEKKAYNEAILAKNDKKRDEMLDFVNRFKAKATKAKQAQSRMRMIEKMDSDMDQHRKGISSRHSPKIKFLSDKSTGVVPFKIKSVSKSYGENKVLNDVNFEVERGNKIAVIGPNGVGKSTLLKIIVSELEADQGECQIGHNVELAYLPQDMESAVQGGGTVLDWFQANSEPKSLTEHRKVLGSLLFSGDDALKKVKTLSGGERARLILAQMVDKRANVLVLDEPTNHLDMEAIDNLIEALNEFKGTVIFVSHNRHFVASIATRVIEIGETEIKDILGGYDDYLFQTQRDHLNRNVSLKKRNNDTKDAAEKEFSEEEKIKLREQEKKLKKEVKAFENDISKYEKTLEKLHVKISDPSMYEGNKNEELTDLNKKNKEAEDDLSKIMKDWEAIGAKLETVQEKIALF